MNQAFLTALQSQVIVKPKQQLPEQKKDAIKADVVKTPTPQLINEIVCNSPISKEWELHKMRVNYLVSLGYDFSDLIIIATAHLYSAHKDDPDMPVCSLGVN